MKNTFLKRALRTSALVGSFALGFGDVVIYSSQAMDPKAPTSHSFGINYHDFMAQQGGNLKAKSREPKGKQDKFIRNLFDTNKSVSKDNKSAIDKQIDKAKNDKVIVGEQAFALKSYIQEKLKGGHTNGKGENIREQRKAILENLIEKASKDHDFKDRMKELVKDSLINGADIPKAELALEILKEEKYSKLLGDSLMIDLNEELAKAKKK